jgi:spore maturation protein CgeB
MKGRMAWALKIPALKSTLLKFKPLIKRLAQTQAVQNSVYPSSILENMQPPVFGMDMYRALAQSKISFNIHIEAAGKYAGNMRLFESTGAGACLLTDWKSNIHDLFEPDTEVVTYRGVDDCIEKAVWLMEHPKECEEIAKRGQARILKEHSFAHRAQQLDEIIRENFK